MENSNLEKQMNRLTLIAVLYFIIMVLIGPQANAQMEQVFDSMDKCLERRAKFRYYDYQTCVEGIMDKTEAACFYINISERGQHENHLGCNSKDYYAKQKPYRDFKIKAASLFLTKKECESVLEEGKKLYNSHKPSPDDPQSEFCEAGIQPESKKRCYYMINYWGLKQSPDCIEGLTPEDQAKQDKEDAKMEAQKKKDCAKLKKMKGYENQQAYQVAVTMGLCR